VKLFVVDSVEAMGKKGAEVIAAEMKVTPHFVLGLATGSTPETCYAELIKMNKAGEISFKTAITFNLDEYVGLPPEHDQSYRCFMNKKLFDHVDIPKEATHLPDGMAADVDAFCEKYEEMMDSVGGVDVQVLGIGQNGHIGFNEPGSSLASRTRRVKLTKNTIQANARFFEKAEDVPTEAITMGIGTILEARKILLLASGANKTDAVAAALEGPVSVSCPASALQLHPDVTWVIEKEAAAGLKLDWQELD
jgi:glucosamine-6-phosphate deaminase